MLEFLYRKYLLKEGKDVKHMFCKQAKTVNDEENIIVTDYHRLQRRFQKFLHNLNLTLDRRYFQLIMVCHPCKYQSFDFDFFFA